VSRWDWFAGQAVQEVAEDIPGGRYFAAVDDEWVTVCEMVLNNRRTPGVGRSNDVGVPVRDSFVELAVVDFLSRLM